MKVAYSAERLGVQLCASCWKTWSDGNARLVRVMLKHLQGSVEGFGVREVSIKIISGLTFGVAPFTLRRLMGEV